MQNALLVGLSRQMALTHEIDILANNIANVDTTGYKADNAAFSEFLMPGARDNEFATGKDRRVSFVQDRASWIDFSPGAMQHTGNPLDVAIDGKGFLVVQTPRGQRYTRNGALSINSAGQLVTSDGDQVLGTGGPITFQPTDRDIVISPTEALCPPLISRTVTKSPMTMVMTKIEPMAMPGLLSGRMTFHSVCQPEAPPSRAASSRLRSMRTIELKIGTTMNSV